MMVDIEQLNTTVAVLTKELQLWQDSTTDYRKVQKDNLAEYFRANRENQEKIIEDIKDMKNRCFARNFDYISMQQHIRDFNKQKDNDIKWFMDGKLWLMTSVVAVINVLLAFFLNHHTTLAQVKNGN